MINEELLRNTWSDQELPIGCLINDIVTFSIIKFKINKHLPLF